MRSRQGDLECNCSMLCGLCVRGQCNPSSSLLKILFDSLPKAIQAAAEAALEADLFWASCLLSAESVQMAGSFASTCMPQGNQGDVQG